MIRQDKAIGGLKYVHGWVFDIILFPLFCSVIALWLKSSWFIFFLCVGRVVIKLCRGTEACRADRKSVV